MANPTDGTGGENDNSFRFAGSELRPIHIAYDKRLLSLTYETLGFDYIEDGTEAMSHSEYTDKEGSWVSSAKNGYGNFLPLVTTGKGFGDFGVSPEARPITFILLTTLICFRLLPVNSMYEFVTRIKTLEKRYATWITPRLSTPVTAVPQDSGLCNGQWSQVRQLIDECYGTDYDPVRISTRQELYLYPWSLFDSEFIVVWRAIKSGNSMGSFPTQAEWNANVDTTTHILTAIGTDAKIILDGSSAIVNAACPVPKAASKLCNASPIARLTAATKITDAASPYAAKLAEALSTQAKGSYDAFAGANQKRLIRRYEIDYNRRRYIHRNFTAFAGKIPKAISLLVPANMAAGQANDPLVADPVVMPSNVFVMPDSSMRPGANPR